MQHAGDSFYPKSDFDHLREIITTAELINDGVLWSFLSISDGSKNFNGLQIDTE